MTSNRRVGRIAFGATAVLFVVLMWSGHPLRTEAAPAGIISFEFAGTSARAIAMLESWDTTARAHVAFNLALDYLFLVAYAVWLWAALRSLASRLSDKAARRTRRLASAMGLAATLDAIENAALGVILSGAFQSQTAEIQVDAGWPALAFACASVKFALVFVAFGVLAWGLVRPSAKVS